MKKLIAAIVLLVLLAVAPVAAQITVATGVSDDATSANSQPKLGRDRTGTIYLTFVKPSGGSAQIFVASSRDGGRGWQVQQITSPPAYSRYPALIVGPDDRVHLAWTQYDEAVGKVYYARFDGRRWTAPVKVSPGQTYAGVPALAVDSQGIVHIVWYGIREQAPVVRTRHGSLYEILYSSFSNGRWTPPELISPGIPDSINPALVIDDRGLLHSAWYQFDLRAYQVRYTEQNRAWMFPKQISSGSDDAFAVAMTAGPEGSVYLVWERRETGGSGIYFAEHHQRWSGQQPVSAAGQPAFNPTIAVDDRNRLYVVWDSSGQIYLRRRDGQWLGTERLATEGQSTNPILSESAGVVDLMWTQRIGGENRVQFASIGGQARPLQPAPSRSPWGLVILVLILLAAVWQYRRMRAVTSDR